MFFISIQAILLVLLCVLIVASLRLLRKYEMHFPPLGARRVVFNRDIGDIFPLEELPSPVRDQVQSRETVFLFMSRGCSICASIKGAIPHFARAYRDMRFVVLGLETADLAPISGDIRVIFTTGLSLMDSLGIGMLPYVIKVKNDRITELGVINTPDHLESIVRA